MEGFLPPPVLNAEGICMGIYGSLCASIEVYAWVFTRVYERLCVSIGVYGCLWGFEEIYEGLWKFMGLMGIYG